MIELCRNHSVLCGLVQNERLTELEQGLVSCAAPVSNSLHCEYCFLVSTPLLVSLRSVRGAEQVMFSAEVDVLCAISV